MNKLEQDSNRICDLISYCERDPKLYNKVANDINTHFGVRSAEISLLVTYYLMKWGVKSED